jgi:glutathione S-transferase
MLGLDSLLHGLTAEERARKVEEERIAKERTELALSAAARAAAAMQAEEEARKAALAATPVSSWLREQSRKAGEYWEKTVETTSSALEATNSTLSEASSHSLERAKTATSISVEATKAATEYSLGASRSYMDQAAESTRKLALAGVSSTSEYMGRLQFQSPVRLSSEPQLVLWGSSSSPRVLRVLWLLEEVGVHYEHRPLRAYTGDVKLPAFEAIAPRGTELPVLQDKDAELTLCESAAMNTYVCERLGHVGTWGLCLLPAGGTPQRALYDSWCFTIVGELDGMGLSLHMRHVEQRAVHGEASRAVEAARLYFMQRVSHVIAVLRTSPCILGKAFSAADVLLTSVLHWALRIGWLPGKELSASDAAVVTEYVTRMTSRPAYQAAVSKP